jgi:hypothetical protein
MPQRAVSARADVLPVRRASLSEKEFGTHTNVNEIFHISEAALRTRVRVLAVVPLIVLGVVGIQVYTSPKDPMVSIAVAAMAIGISLFVVIRQYREFAKFAAKHSLTLGDDALLFRDGGVELRVPYSSVMQVTVPRTLRDGSAVFMQCRDQPRMQLYGYGGFPRLIELLLKKVPHADVRTRGFLVFTTSRG